MATDDNVETNADGVAPADAAPASDAGSAEAEPAAADVDQPGGEGPVETEQAPAGEQALPATATGHSDGEPVADADPSAVQVEHPDAAAADGGSAGVAAAQTDVQAPLPAASSAPDGDGAGAVADGADGEGADGASAVAAPDEDAPEAVADGEEADGASAVAAPDGDAPEAAAGSAAAEVAEDGAKKKRRRRRRKRKPGSAEAGHGAGEGEAGGEQADGGDEGRPSESPRKSARPERPAFSMGDQVFGKVCRVTDHAVWVDIAGKAVGLFDLRELTGDPPKEGDQFIAKVQSGSTRGGMVMLVTEPVKPTDAKEEIRTALEANEPLEGWVTGVIKGGLEVDLKGLRAFAPASHVELRPSSDLSHLLGQCMPFLVSHYAKKGRDIVVSRKPMLEESAERERGEQLAKIQPDTICKGIVRKVLGWGAFVALPEFGDVEGVVHMTEASHDRAAKLGAVMKVGEEIDVKVLRVDDKGKLWLSRKGAQKDPWDDVKARYQPWSLHRGTVVRLTDFGAFVQLEPGIDGLCHVSDLSFQPVEHPSEAVSVGDQLDVVISHLDAGARKIGLHPAPPEDERELPRQRIQAHQTVQAAIVQVRDNGLAVRILGATGRSQRAYIPANHSGTPRGTDLRKAFPVGQRVEAKVLDVDPRKGEVRLSIRALKDDAEKQAYREYRKQVQREAHFGTFADLLKKS